jgi:hypothetical protein
MNRTATVNAAMGMLAASELYRDFADDIKGTVLYQQELKNAVNRTQQLIMKKVQQTHEIFDTDKAELEYMLTIGVIESFVETIRSLPTNKWDELKSFLEAYRKGEVQVVEDREFLEKYENPSHKMEMKPIDGPEKEALNRAITKCGKSKTNLNRI